jgi:hypothetical protein
MAFGQAAGPPASARQIEELAALLERAGFTSFREARHPFGLTQRQAAGKFAGPEAAELIERLTAAEVVQQKVPGPASPLTADVPGPEVDEPSSATRQRPRSAASLEAERLRGERSAQVLGSLSDQVIVSELERRGWCCIPPPHDQER